MKFRQVLAAAVGVLVVSLAMAVPAAGDSPVTKQQYGDRTEVIAGTGGNDPGDPSASDPANVGSLPFTGLDLALMGAAAAGLLAAGLVIRRRSATEEHGA